jgi:hypothetical protein
VEDQSLLAHLDRSVLAMKQQTRKEKERTDKQTIQTRKRESSYSHTENIIQMSLRMFIWKFYCNFIWNFISNYITTMKQEREERKQLA